MTLDTYEKANETIKLIHEVEHRIERLRDAYTVVCSRQKDGEITTDIDVLERTVWGAREYRLEVRTIPLVNYIAAEIDHEELRLRGLKVDLERL